MADPIFHIRDSYYFEVPKLLYPYQYGSRKDFPQVWTWLDPEFQDWEAHRLIHNLQAVDAGLPPQEKTLEDWHHWGHADHANFGKPLRGFLEEKHQAYVAKFNDWKAEKLRAAREKKEGSIEDAKKLELSDYLGEVETTSAADQDYFEFLRWYHKPLNREKFERAKNEARDL